MDKQKAENHPQPPITHRPGKGEIFSMFVGTALVLIILTPLAVVFLLYAFLFGLILWAMIASVFWPFVQFALYNRLVIQENGLEVYRDGTYCFALWEDMERFGLIGEGDSSRAGIYVRRFEQQRRNPSRYENFTPLTYIALPRKATYPSGVDLETLKQSPFGQNLFHYAPHLFDEQEIIVEKVGESAAELRAKEIARYRSKYRLDETAHKQKRRYASVFRATSSKLIKAFEDGLRIRLQNKVYFVPWDKTIQFKWRNYGYFTGWGILIEEGAPELNRWNHGEIIDFIPLSRFMEIPGNPREGEPVNLEHFKKTPLGEDLYYYAPHLFDAPKYKNERIEEIIQHGAAALQQNSTSTSGGK